MVESSGISNKQDSAERSKMAGLAGEISASFDLLAAVAERVERTPAITAERIVFGWEF